LAVDTARVVAAIALGLAFLVAGGSKLAARESWASQARGLEAPSWSIPLVPWVELVLGAALVAQLGRRAMAVGAAALLVSFTVLIAARLREGKRPPCACFGAWSARPIGIGHVVRNAVLLSLALVAAS
jgi:uncharacterized membrane protein YphA (DoxX/SURF4 family)